LYTIIQEQNKKHYLLKLTYYTNSKFSLYGYNVLLISEQSTTIIITKKTSIMG